MKFEGKIKDIFPEAEINQAESSFFLKSKNLNLEKAWRVLKIIQNSAGGSTDIEINTTQKLHLF